MDDDDDIDNASPPSVFTNATSANLWTSKTTNDMVIDAEKFRFVRGGDGGGGSPGNGSGGRNGRSSWMTSSGTRMDGHHDDVQNLNLASRGGASPFQIKEEGDDLQQRSSQLPACCLLRRRAICASLMVLALLVILIDVAMFARNNGEDGGGGGSVEAGEAEETGGQHRIAIAIMLGVGVAYLCCS